GSAAGSTAAGGGAAGTSASGDDKLYGYFNVTLNPALEETNSPPNTTLVGKLYDGPYPPAKSFAQKMEANGCKLYTPEQFFCQPACSNAVCTADDKCTPYPAAQTVGTVSVTGLGPAAFSMEPKANNYQPPAGTNLPFPPCAAGSQVKLDAAGGQYPAFALSAGCIEPLELAGPVKLMKGQPLTLSWNKGAANDAVNINVLLDISQHGTSKGNITCDVKDTGTLTIPATLVDALLDLGVSGFPTVLVTREIESVPPSAGPKNVFLKLSAPYRRAVEIPGLVSCNDDTQCPQGQTCQPDLKCM
ncbi:MAG TPA: hypothetical protein VJR89_12605, partial [Polyangiales bacterium]|nr:hypothetical protein [Polyangiales bacterium]